MRLDPENIDDLRKGLADQPGDRKVEADEKPSVNFALRALWPGGLVVETPRENYPEVVVEVSKAS